MSFPVLAPCLAALALVAAPTAQDPAPAKPSPAAPPPLAAPVDSVPVLDGATFVRHWQHVVPSADEMAWRVIPWLGTLAEAFAALQKADGGPAARTITFVTGPSRTADIELTLVVGVHGPKALHVLLVRDDG